MQGMKQITDELLKKGCVKNLPDSISKEKLRMEFLEFVRLFKDRHTQKLKDIEERINQSTVKYVDPETGEEKECTYKELMENSIERS